MSPDCLPTLVPLPSHACFPLQPPGYGEPGLEQVILLQTQPAPLSFPPRGISPLPSPSKSKELFLLCENPLGTELPLTLALSDSHWV